MSNLKRLIAAFDRRSVGPRSQKAFVQSALRGSEAVAGTLAAHFDVAVVRCRSR